MQKDFDKACLQRALDTLVSNKSIHQAMMAVESGDQSFCWSAVAGETGTGHTQINVDSPFFIASIDKLFNAVIIMLLCEQGKLALNDPLCAYLPSELMRGLHVYKGIDYSDRLTVRHLLSHTSGLADWLEDYADDGRSLIEMILEIGDLTLSFMEIAEMVRTKLKPHFPPQDLSGGKVNVRYSDTNYILLIALIEKLCGQPLHIVHENMLYKPLSLHGTYLPGFSKPLTPTSFPVPLRAGGQVIQIPGLMKSFRGIYSTTSDTIAFLRRLTRNGVFQKRETFSEMQCHWNRFGLPLDRAALRSPGWPIEYGLGLMRFGLPRVFTSMRKLPAVIGHTGSTGCWLFWCPEFDLYFSGSVDESSAGAIPYRVIPGLLKAISRF